VRSKLLLLAGLLLPGCGGALDPSRLGAHDDVVDQSDVLSARVDAGIVHLSTTAQEPVYYMIVNPQFLALWAACTEPATCPHVRPGQPTQVPLTSMLGYDPGAGEGVVYHWHLVPSSNGGYQPDIIRALRITF
jgi:hypothetical protein